LKGGQRRKFPDSPFEGGQGDVEATGAGCGVLRSSSPMITDPEYRIGKLFTPDMQRDKNPRCTDSRGFYVINGIT